MSIFKLVDNKTGRVIATVIADDNDHAINKLKLKVSQATLRGAHLVEKASGVDGEEC